MVCTLQDFAEEYLGPSSHQGISGTHGVLSDILPPLAGMLGPYRADGQPTASVNQCRQDSSTVAEDGTVRLEIEEFLVACHLECHCTGYG